MFSCEHCQIFKDTCSEEHVQTTASVYRKFKLQIIYKRTSRILSILGFTKRFLTSSALRTLILPNLYYLLSLSHLLNISNVSFFNSLSRLHEVFIENLYPSTIRVFKLYIAKLLSSRDKHCAKASLIKVTPLKVGAYLILEVHNMLFTHPE